MTQIELIYELYKKYPLISTDSRKIEPGSIFFALKGDNFNGNWFAADALKKGAACAVIDEKDFFISDRTVIVNDVLQSLKDLANFHRIKLAIPILGITGTNGKTTTKELVAAVLKKKFNVKFTHGNLNNHIGVPLTLLSMDNSTQFGVVEMGANHPGEIAELCKIADPDYGIITNIGKAHLEGFGSFEGVIQTKSELYHYLERKNGVVFFNNDNELLRSLTSEIKNKVSFGKSNADFTGDLIPSPPYVHVKARFAKGDLYLNSKLTGDYNFENIMAAACIGNYFNVDPIKIQEAIAGYQPENNRSQIIHQENLTIVMDAYNANPTSMQASIRSFMTNTKGNTWLILGDMLELGKYSLDEHLAILALLKEYPASNIILVGKQFNGIASEFGFKSFTNVDELCLMLQANPITEGNVLIKGSRGIQLEKILKYL